MKKPNVRFWPSGVSIRAEEGATLLETARRAGYILQTECGGQGTCRRCKVRLISGNVFPTGEPNLTTAEKDQNFILACLSRITGDLEVQIPPESEFSFSREGLPVEWSPGEHPGQEILSRGLKLDPPVRRFKVEVAPPSLQDNSSDFDRLCRTLINSGVNKPVRAGIESLRSLSDHLRRNNGVVHTVLFQDNGVTEVLGFTPDGESPLYGLILDVGTTTLYARLLDLESGEVAAEASDLNWQIPCGADIIHRIVYAAKPGGLDELRRLVLEATEGLILRLLEDAGADRDGIVSVSLAGNTTMEHLFLGLDPRTIREEPYVPTVTRFSVFKAAEIGLNVFPHAPVFFSPSVASYVGGDITAGLLAAGVHRDDGLTLYVDLGTNGEVALGNREWLTACACSAGPAFEGGGVRCGMRALPGAIDQVKKDPANGELIFRVIAGETPKGICGSGLIDLLAELRATNRITARGKLNPDADLERIRKTGRKAEMVLVKRTKEEGFPDVAITEVDLDNLIRTKGAIFAGIMTLLKGVGLEPGAIERVVIAGAFGRYLDVENAVRIGMLPDLPRDRFEYIGNGSLRGAGLALLSRQLRKELHEIADKITYFELSTWPGYMDEFMAALFLPHTDAGLFPSVKIP